MLGITNANAKAGVTLEELEAALENQTTQLYKIIKGEEPPTSVFNLYKDNTTAGVYPDSTFEYVYTSEVTSFQAMFSGCTGLTAVNDLDTHNGTNFSYIFYNCTSLTSVPALDTSKGTNFNSMFSGCTALTSIPNLDTSNGTDFSKMFASCTVITSVPDLDTSNGTDFNNMFSGCTNLTHVPDLDTSNGTNLGRMFNGCTNLTDIPDLDLGSVYGQVPEFNTTSCTSLTTFRDSPYAPEGHRWNMDHGNIRFGDSPLDRTSILKVFNGVLPAIGTVHTITISSTTNGYLSADDKAIAENKGWTVTVAA